MLRTALCDLLGIEVPIVQAGMGPWASAELAAAVSNAGGIGSLGAGTRAAADLEGQLTRLRRLTDRPFAGQTVGLIREILPAAEIVRRIVAEAEAALQRAVKHIG